LSIHSEQKRPIIYEHCVHSQLGNVNVQETHYLSIFSFISTKIFLHKGKSLFASICARTPHMLGYKTVNSNLKLQYLHAWQVLGINQLIWLSCVSSFLVNLRLWILYLFEYFSKMFLIDLVNYSWLLFKKCNLIV
jgi:hypothetical protein